MKNKNNLSSFIFSASKNMEMEIALSTNNNGEMAVVCGVFADDFY